MSEQDSEKRMELGLTSRERVGPDTKANIERIILESALTDYELCAVTFSKVQADHVALQFGFKRVSTELPSVTLADGNEVGGLACMVLPRNDDSRLNLATLILKHKNLSLQAEEKAIKTITEDAGKIKYQLTDGKS